MLKDKSFQVNPHPLLLLRVCMYYARWPLKCWPHLLKRQFLRVRPWTINQENSILFCPFHASMISLSVILTPPSLGNEQGRRSRKASTYIRVTRNRKVMSMTSRFAVSTSSSTHPSNDIPIFYRMMLLEEGKKGEDGGGFSSSLFYPGPSFSAAATIECTTM